MTPTKMLAKPQKTPAAETTTSRLRLIVSDPMGEAAGPHQEHYARGIQALRTFDLAGYELAVACFRQATDYAPQHAPSWAGLAEAYSYWGFRNEVAGEACEGLYEMSFECASRALRTAPERSDSHRAMAIALRRGPRADAVTRQEEILTALDLDPKDALNWYEYWRAGGYKVPDTALDRCLELDPWLCGAHIDYGAALCERGRLQEAAKEFALAVKVSPTNSLAHYNLAMVLLRLGHSPKAREVLERAIAARPDDSLILDGFKFLGGAASA